MKGLNRTENTGFGEFIVPSSASFPSKHLRLTFYFRQKFSDTWIMRIIGYFTKNDSFETLCHPSNTKIFIGPHNKVLILRKGYKTAEQYSTIFDQNGSYLNSWMSYFSFSNRTLHVDPRIVHHARQILEQKDAIQVAESGKKQFENRIIKMENDLHRMKDNWKQYEGNITRKLKGISDELQRRRYHFDNVHWK